ncbi:hypothetical protein STRTUCAR8_00058, partial [Streptomyces turgidiscabies Car8]
MRPPSARPRRARVPARRTPGRASQRGSRPAGTGWGR